MLITNVHEELSEEDLLDKFADYGQIKNIHLNLDRRSGYVKGYGLIEYQEYSQAKAAIQAFNDQVGDECHYCEAIVMRMRLRPFPGNFRIRAIPSNDAMELALTGCH